MNFSQHWHERLGAMENHTHNPWLPFWSVYLHSLPFIHGTLLGSSHALQFSPLYSSLTIPRATRLSSLHSLVPESFHLTAIAKQQQKQVREEQHPPAVWPAESLDLSHRFRFSEPARWPLVLNAEKSFKRIFEKDVEREKSWRVQVYEYKSMCCCC